MWILRRRGQGDGIGFRPLARVAVHLLPFARQRLPFLGGNGVDLPLTFPAAGTGRLTLPLFFVVYTVNQAVNFPLAGHGGRRVTSVVAPCGFFFGGCTLRLVPPSPVMTPATSAVKTAHNGRLRCQNEKGRRFPPGLSFFVSERRYGVTKRHGKHEGD